MPVYEYKCNACGRELEVQQRMSDPELTDCEACGKPALERLISRTAFTLKGGGWYKDLYASTKPESKSSETKTETKTDGASASTGDKGSSTPAAPSSGSGESSSGSGSSGSGSGSSGSGSAAAALERQRRLVGLQRQQGRGERLVIGQIIDGKAVAAKLRGEVAEAAAALRKHNVAPTLAVVLVGDDPASAVYVKSKTKAAREAGVDIADHKLPQNTTQDELMQLVRTLNDDPIVDGILVQMPLPSQLDSDAVIRALDPAKDVDGLTSTSLGYLAQGRPVFVPCTPKGCMRLLREVNAHVEGARAVVLGRSLLVGKPIALLLQNANATVTVCHSKTRDLADEVRRADIVVAAIGKPELVKGDWIKDGAIVLDVGINRTPDGKLVGDVAFTQAAQRARAITPVPGGVGPMTIACLLENTVEAARRRRA